MWGALRLAGRIAPWVLVAVTVVTVLLLAATPAADVARYGAYWLFCLVLPGTLVFRALRGSRGNLPEDIGYGAATGLVLELGVWATATALDATAWLRLWPVPVVILFLALRPLRRHWRIGERRQLPALWSWGMAAVMIVTTLWIAGQVRLAPLPPADAGYYPDLLYHLSLVRELMRPMPFEVPQHAGDPLHYHYLSDAHMAAASHISGVYPPTVVFRLWLIPVVLAGILVVAAVARELAGPAWAGPVAAALTALGGPLAFSAPTAAFSVSPISVNSPSLTYLLAPMMLLTVLCADAVRDRALGPAWALLAAAALVCAGTKPSGPPLLLAGLALAIPASAILRRRVPWRAVAAFGCVLAAMGTGVLLFVEAGAGSEIQLLSMLQWTEPYQATIGVGWPLATKGLLPPALTYADEAAWQFALLLVLWYAISQLPMLACPAALATRATRTEVTWLLAGGTAAGIGSLWLLFHPGAGQLYFLRSAFPLAVLGAVVLLATAAPGRRSVVLLPAALVGAVVAGVLLAWPSGPRPAPYMAAWLTAMYAPLLRAAAIVAGLIVIWWLLRTRLLPLRGHGPAISVATLLGASLFLGVAGMLPAAQHGWARSMSEPTASEPGYLTAAEVRAALWLDANAGRDDVIATNVHCVFVVTRPNCETRAFWVSALSGRPAVVEGWAFVPATLAAHGVAGFSYSQQPPPDWARFALNERVFADPTEEDLRRLREEYGVRWLFADTRASPVASTLAAHVTIRYADAPVTIYELSDS